ncbi:MAG: transcription elongation factor GreA [Candidatus Beckwithbacteria bacterium]|nr:transcription elongation factor GreA [Candidatus Beckwithbacteria bacterium]
MNTIPFTQDGLDKISAERDKLTAERPEVVGNLQKAREMGDLSENGYYKESKARLGWLDGRLRYLNRLIKQAEIVKSGQVTLTDGKKTYEYKIVGGYESNPQEKTISYQSPLGRAILGKKAGETVKVQTPNGLVEYKILKISA